jgi:hypothetical protein
LNGSHAKLETVRDHACPYCRGVAFRLMSTLKTHIETVHKKRKDHAWASAATAKARRSGRPAV